MPRKGNRYMIVSWCWHKGHRCEYARRNVEPLTRRDYVAEVLAVKYGH